MAAIKKTAKKKPNKQKEVTAATLIRMAKAIRAQAKKDGWLIGVTTAIKIIATVMEKEAAKLRKMR